jgi:hypothetical protein
MWVSESVIFVTFTKKNVIWSRILENGWTKFFRSKNTTGMQCTLLKCYLIMFSCWWGSLSIRGHWGDQDVDGRIILRWIFRKLEGVVGTG